VAGLAVVKACGNALIAVMTVILVQCMTLTRGAVYAKVPLLQDVADSVPSVAFKLEPNKFP